MAESTDRDALVARVSGWNAKLDHGAFGILNDPSVIAGRVALSELVRSDERGEVSFAEPALLARYQLGRLEWFDYLGSERAHVDSQERALELLLPCFVHGGFDDMPSERLLVSLGHLAQGPALKQLERLTTEPNSVDVESAERLAGLWRRIVRSQPRRPDEAWRWHCLAVVLSRVYPADDQRSVAALLEAAEAADKAVELGYVYDLDKAEYLLNAGRVYEKRYEQTGDQAYRATALARFEQVDDLRAAAASARISGYIGRSRLTGTDDPGGAAALLREAVALLPLLAPRHLERGTGLRELSGFSGLARRAAALTLHAGSGSTAEPAFQAVQALELGRAVLLGHGLTARTDLSELVQQRPELAREFAELRDWLDEETTRPTDPDVAQQRQSQREFWANQLDCLLREIRSLEGFQRFGLPLERDQLLALADQGPIVILTTTEDHSDALLITGDGIEVVHFSGLDEQQVNHRVSALQEQLETTRPGSSMKAQLQAQAGMTELLRWLWEEIAEPVLRTVTADHRTTAEPPRVWWMPCGPFALLPVHAAGKHTKGSRDTVIELTASSYTPTLRALHYARGQAAKRGRAGSRTTHPLIVAAPRVAGQNELDVRQETEALIRARPHARLLEGLPPSPAAATATNVLKHLPDCDIAHFACHAETDPDDPLLSRIILDGDADGPLTVDRLASVHLDQASLAYLSACRSADPSNLELADEVLHLASAFQLAGFPQVVGTLWNVQDSHAARVASDFYAALGPTEENAARVFRDVVSGVRARTLRSPYIWAPFVHIGI
ncbi:CHAT domain-containing protein [Streptomyces sp. NPDC001787]|uniref:CHAT domain-containing protein n=1 Tax=Streptomyces sp. NPDC001787 TaxID=3154523 RepID=UPI00331AF1C3